MCIYLLLVLISFCVNGLKIPRLPDGKLCEGFKSDTLSVLNCQDGVFIVGEEIPLEGNLNFYDPNKDLTIHATTLTISGNLKLPSRNVYLVAEEVILKTPVAFDISGKRGNKSCDEGCIPPDPPLNYDDGTPGYDGSNGGNGGLFNMVIGRSVSCPSLSDEDLESDYCLKIYTNGGNGGNGQSGGNGFGDDHIGGRAGAGGNGGNGGNVVIYSLQVPLPFKVYFSSNGGMAGKSGKAGTPSCYDSKCVPKPDRIPKSGKGGSYSITKVNSSILEKAVNDEMLELALNLGEKLYLNGEYSSARDQFLWIIYVVNGQNVSLANTITVLGDSGCRHPQHDQCGDPETYRLTIAKTAQAYLLQMSQMKDFFGYFYNYCPPLSLEFYRQKSLDDILTLRDVEVTYDAFVEADKNMQSQLQSVEKSLQTNQHLLDQYTSDIQTYTQEAYDENQVIYALAESYVTLLQTMGHDGAECVVAIEDWIKKQEREQLLGSIFSLAMSIISFVKDVAMAVIDLIDEVGWFKEIGDIGKILKDVGAIIHNIHNIADEMKKAEDSIEVVNEEFNSFASDMTEEATADNNKLVMEFSQYEEVISKYTNLPQCATYEDDLNNLLNVLESRNNHIVNHDTAVLNAYKSQQLKSHQVAKVQSVQNQLVDDFNPETLVMMNYMQGVYDSMRMMASKSLYEYHLANRCNFLTKEKISFDLKNSALFLFTHELIRTNSARSYEISQNQVQPFSIELKFTEDDTPMGVFDDFRNHGFFNVSVPISGEDFRGFSNIWVDDFVFCFDGVKASKDHVRFVVTHTGNIINRNSNGTIWMLQGPAVDVLQVVELDSCEILRVGNTVSHGKFSIGGGNVPNLFLYGTDVKVKPALDVEGRFSPFSYWMVSMKDDSTMYNPGLDLSKVTTVRLRMSGTYQPLLQDAVVPPTLGGAFNDFNVVDGEEEGRCGFTCYGSIILGVIFWILLLVLSVLLLCLLARFVNHRYKLRKEKIKKSGSLKNSGNRRTEYNNV